MEVPFELLGNGQVGRLAYQVIGKNGPIYNPQNIRFMPAGEAISAFPENSSFEIGTAMAGIDLLASFGILAMSRQIMGGISKISKQLTDVALSLDAVTDKLDQLIDKTELIDVKVSENNLRHGLNHILKESLSDDGIDINKISHLFRDLETFCKSVPDLCIGGALGLRLSSDVVFNLELVYRVLFNLRCLIISRHNQSVFGDPRKTISFDHVEDYLEYSGTINQVGNIVEAYRIADEGIDSLNEIVNSRFTFADNEDIEIINDHFNEKIWIPILEATFDPLSQNIWVNLIKDNDLEEDDFSKDVDEYRNSWLWHTDAGLLWRIYSELKWVREGYNLDLCKGRLNDSPLSEIHEITVICERGTLSEK